MSLNLDPYTSPKIDPVQNFKLIYNYFSKENCDYQVYVSDIYDWEDEHLVQTIQCVCALLDIDESKVTLHSQVKYWSDNCKINFVPFGVGQILAHFGKDLQQNYFKKKLQKHFLSMTHRPTWDRLCVASFLYKYYRNTSCIKFTNHDDMIQMGIGLDEAYAKYSTHSERKDQILNFVKILPIDDVQEKKSPQELSSFMSRTSSQYTSQELYKKVGVEIVNETNLTKGLYCTEKIARPIAYYTPFVVMGPIGYLDHLRMLGFKTFSSVWDESYDSHQGKTRLEMLYNTLHEIANMDLKKLNDKTHDICVYNREYLHSFQWSKKMYSATK
jgi:hypothetical protein